MMTSTQLTIRFDPVASRAAKDRGMTLAARKAGSEWLEAAVTDFVAYLRTHGAGPLEAWKQSWLERGKPEPLSQNAYGSVTRVAASRGLIRPTGRFTNARAVSAHARKVMEWTVI